MCLASKMYHSNTMVWKKSEEYSPVKASYTSMIVASCKPNLPFSQGIYYFQTSTVVTMIHFTWNILKYFVQAYQWMAMAMKPFSDNSNDCFQWV